MLNQCHKTTDTTTDTTHISRILELAEATSSGRIVASCVNRLENDVRFLKWVRDKRYRFRVKNKRDCYSGIEIHNVSISRIFLAIFNLDIY